MKKRIILDIDPEPPAYHDGFEELDGEAPYTIGLSPLAIDDVQATNAQGKKKEEKAAKDFIKYVVEQMDPGKATIRFAAYELLPNDLYAEPTEASLISDIEVERIYTPELIQEFGKRLLDWLDLRADDPDPVPYSRLSADAVDVDGDRISSGDLIRAARSWDAPTPQQLGISRVVRVTGADLNTRIILVPYFGNIEPNESFEITQILGGFEEGSTDGAVRVKANLFADDEEEIELETSTLLQFPTKGLKPLNVATGFLKAGEDPETLRRVLDRIEVTSGSRLSPLQALLDVLDNLLRDESLTSDDPDASRDDVHKNLNWLAAAGASASLDPIRLALLSPGQEHVVGGLLARYLRQLINKLPAGTDGPMSLQELPPGLLARALRIALRNDALMMYTADESDAVKRLRKVLELKETGHDDLNLLDDLLKQFVNPDDSPTKPDLRDVMRALEELEAMVRQEHGAEKIILRLLQDKAEKNGPFVEEVGALAKAELSWDLTEKEIENLRDAVDQAWEPFRLDIDEGFDGAQVMEGAAGRLISAAITRDVEQIGDLSPESIKSVLIASELWRLRFRISESKEQHEPELEVSTTNLELIGKVGWCPAPEPFPGEGVWGKLPGELDRHFKRVAQSLTASPDDRQPGSPAITGEVLEGEDLHLMVPDKAPAPLAVQIASELDSDTMQSFDELFNGICVLIDRQDVTDEKLNWRGWAHANLVDIQRFTGYKPLNETAHKSHRAEYKENGTRTVRPFFPAAIDGRRPCFISYDGTPLASPAFDDTRTQQSAAGASGWLSRPPFFVSGDASDDPVCTDTQRGLDDQRMRMPPVLAYGRSYRAAAFAVTDGGCLPRAVRYSAADPWTPWHPRTGLPIKNLQVVACQRRTAIGRLNVKPAELGSDAVAALEGVVPLDADYPRQVISATDNVCVPLDIYRNSDGSGGLRLPLKEQEQPVSVSLSDLLWIGDKGHLLIQLMKLHEEGSRAVWGEVLLNSPLQVDMTKTEGQRSLQIIVGMGTVEVWEAGSDKPLHKRTFDPESLRKECFWLRLSINSNSAGNDATLSFADTTTAESRDGYDAKPETPTRLLIANTSTQSDEEKIWKSGVPETAELSLKLPRVGYKDFERWTANGSLQDGNQPIEIDEDIEQALEFAYLLRGVNDGRLDSESSIASLIEALPDPAVAGVRVTLALQDALSGHTHRPIQQIISTPGLLNDDRPPRIPENDEKDLLKVIKEFREYLEQIDSRFWKTITVMCDGGWAMAPDPQNKNNLSVRLPPGVTARLTFQILIPSQYCSDQVVKDGEESEKTPAVFDPGIVAQHISDKFKINGRQKPLLCHVFEGPEIVVETLDDTLNDNETDLATLGGNVIVCDASGKDRSYAIRVNPYAGQLPDPKLRRLWRSVSHIDTETQEWRFSGRPIYNWPACSDLNPESECREAASANESSTKRPPVFELKPNPSPSLRQFETEAFFDRSDRDASRMLRRIEPLPPLAASATTGGPGQELRRIMWGKPSATYLRHRFGMRSRYASAMANGGVDEVFAACAGSTSESNGNGKAGEKTGSQKSEFWTMRVMIRASVARTELNRPQLRALIPLTIPPSAGGNEPVVPPILSVLEEEPFVYGGLAERVLGMVHTGVHFGFKPNQSQDSSSETDAVAPTDVRPEFGPVPYLSVKSTPIDEVRRLTVAHEGPIGLTFDSANITEPTWSNSQHLFSPIRSDATRLDRSDELDLGLSLVRILDPDWCDAPAVKPPSLLSADEPSLSLPAGRSWLVRFSRMNMPILSLAIEGEEPLGIFSVAAEKKGKKDSELVVRVRPEALDGTLSVDDEVNEAVSAGKPSIDVVVFHDDGESKNPSRLMLLHQALGEGRYRATFLLAPPQLGASPSSDRQDAIARGQTRTPMVLASLDWSVKRDLEDTRPTHLECSAAISAWEATASATTETQWASIPRDASRIFISMGRRKTESISIKQVQCSIEIKEDKHTLVFKRKEKPDRVWPRGKLGAPNVSSPIHRHLAIALTDTVAGIGPKLETFRYASLLLGRTLPLDLDQPISHARLIEIETPARPVYLRNHELPSSIPAIYREAYFDTEATIVGQLDRAIYLFIHFIQTSEGSLMLGNWEFTLRAVRDDQKQPRDVTMKIEIPKDEEYGPDSMVIQIQPRPSKSSKYFDCAYRRITPSGEVSPWITATASDVPSDSADHQGVFFRARPAEGEDDRGMWADVSLLHGPPHTRSESHQSDDISLDFDWLFTGHESSLMPAESVRAGALRQLKEVQARIVAVSQPIEIDRAEAVYATN